LYWLIVGLGYMCYNGYEVRSGVFTTGENSFSVIVKSWELGLGLVSEVGGWNQFHEVKLKNLGRSR